MENKLLRAKDTHKFIFPFLFGLAIGALSLALDEVGGGDFQFKPFPDWDKASLDWKSATEGSNYELFLQLKENYSHLKCQAIWLKFCMAVFDHGFLYLILPALACVVLEQLKHVRAIDCIRKSLSLAAHVILFFGTAAILVIAASGKLPVEQTFDQMVVYLLRGFGILVAFLTVTGVFHVFLLTSLCVFMARWEPEKCS